MMQIVKLNIGASSAKNQPISQVQSPQPKEVVKGNLKIKYCYKRNQTKNNDHQSINYGNSFSDCKHFQQLQVVKQFGKSGKLNINPQVNIIQSTNPVQNLLTANVSSFDLMKFPQGTVRTGKFYHRRVSIKQRTHRKYASVITQQKKPLTARNFDYDEVGLQSQVEHFKNHTNFNQNQEYRPTIIDGSEIRNLPRNFDAFATQKAKGFIKKQLNRDSQSISQINPYTKKQYLYYQKRQEQRSLRQIQQAKRAQKLQSIIKPCQISSVPLSSRSISTAKEKMELIRPNTQSFKRKLSLNCDPINRKRLTSFTNLGKLRKIGQDLNPWQTELNCQDADYLF